MYSLIDSISRQDIVPLQSYTNPPTCAELCSEAVLIYLNLPLKPIAYVKSFFGNHSFWEVDYQSFREFINRSTLKQELKKILKEGFNEEKLELLEPFLEARWFTE